MTDSESESTNSISLSTTCKPKSTKVNFVLLKQILDDDLSEITDSDDQELNCKENQSNNDANSARDTTTEKDSSGPIGRYPVTFSKCCRSKSCQTRLSAFPLFSVPDDTEWISEEEENVTPKREKVKSMEKKRKKKTKLSNELDSPQKELEKAPEKTKNDDGTRKDFSTEHQLKESKNPILQAWIHRKNKLARKAKKEERKEKRAQRAAVSEEEQLRIDRLELSDKKVKDWFKTKRKEARKLFRQNHRRVSPFDMALDEQTDSPPHSEYKVIKTFQQKHNSLKSRRSSSLSNSSKYTKEQDIETVHSTSKLTNTKDSYIRTRSPTKDISDNTKFANPDKPSSVIQRPKTASLARSAVKTKPARPKTAKPSSKGEGTTTDESPKQIRTLSYDDWLKSKRELDKKRVIERRHELIDSHLDAVISKLGKKRVENILSARKQVDTGLKNFLRTVPKSPSPQKDSYKWRKGNDGPRPEPQGCDCPEAEHVDSENNLKTTSFSQLNPSPLTPRRKAKEFCKEVTEKCDDLKPSLDKVLAVLDSEIKKCSAEKKPQNNTSKSPHSISSTTNATCNDTESRLEQLSLPGTVNDGATKPPSRPRSARPKSARLGLVNNTSLTQDEVKKKIFHDMDVLGLCHSEENLESAAKAMEGNHGDKMTMVNGGSHSNTVTTNVNIDNKVTMTNVGNHGNDDAIEVEGYNDNTVAKLPDKRDSVLSTVRSNYFDYGAEIDVPTMNSNK